MVPSVEELPAPQRKLESLLCPGAGVLLTFTGSNGSQRKVEARCRRLAGDRLTILLTGNPTDNAVPDLGRMVHLTLEDGGTPVEAYARVLERGAPDTPLVLSHPAAVVRTNRRNLYRVSVDLTAQTSFGAARLVDLSGGGCLLAPGATELPKMGQQVDVNIELPTEKTPLALSGIVVRHTQSEGGAPRIGVKFCGISVDEETKVIRYVHARQRELLRRGVLVPAREA